MRRAILLIGVVLAVAASGLAQQRPLITDDIDITPPGSLEIGLGVDFFQRARFPLSGLEGELTRVGDIRIRTGFAANVELQIEGTIQNYLAINSRGVSAIPLTTTGNSTNDFDDFTVSAKVKLRNETRSLPAVGLKFGFQMPNTDQARGIGTNQINIFSKIILQKKFGGLVRGTPRFNTYGNIGLGIMTAPIERFTPDGIEVDGVAYPLDTAVCATGFAAMTGSFDKIAITGRKGLTLAEKWRAGPRAYLGPCACLRGDFGRIVVEEGANIQDTCMLHGFPGKDTEVGRGATIGHGAVLHGCVIGPGALVGMNAVVNDNAEVGEDAVVAALAFVRAEARIPPRSLAAAKIASMSEPSGSDTHMK